MESRLTVQNVDNTAAEKEALDKEKKAQNQEFIQYYQNKGVDQDQIKK
jgi:hypothetical protein